jgi:hypothetical protein
MPMGWPAGVLVLSHARPPVFDQGFPQRQCRWRRQPLGSVLDVDGPVSLRLTRDRTLIHEQLWNPSPEITGSKLTDTKNLSDLRKN